ncbi:polysaccharide biosynthesis tyrosine autokinase [Planctomicrobium sp. SH668]|uniref:polysaccharide biosynthesis tyrosine autokinase n=1 Tax=Planctomicrobium sp. SH668 TaxID=3448126 RepID=UPI003F5C84C3
MNDYVNIPENLTPGKNPNAPPAPASAPAMDIVGIIKGRSAVILCCAAIGVLLGVVYWANATEVYESKAKVLITLKDVRPKDDNTSGAWSEDRINAETLANHIEIVQSQSIISKALDRANWQEMPFFQDKLASDPTFSPGKYVIKQLKLAKGGSGSARDARSLTIKFRHEDPQDSLKILQAIVLEYESFLDEQISKTMNAAYILINEARDKLALELRKSEDQYVAARRSAPVLYAGDGSGNVYMDKFKRLEDERLSIDIQYTTALTRLQKIEERLADIDLDNLEPLELMSLIDSESLQRLTTYVSFSSGQSADFLKNQPDRLAAATAQYDLLTSLRAQLAELESNFRQGHPDVINLKKRIQMVEDVIKNARKESEFTTIFDQMTPSKIAQTYLGYLRHELVSLSARKDELTAQAAAAEAQSKELIEFELRDKMLLGEITRKQALFDGTVDQLRKMDTASGLSGYAHEVLDAPEEGEIVWPSLPICGAGGLILGLLGGVCLAIVLDQMDNRFRSPIEIDQVLSLPVIGQVGRIRGSGSNRNASRMIVNALAPEAESFRLLRTYFLREVKEGNLRTAMVSSCQTKDGKSTIMANLGASFSELGIKTLIIDADMRAPTQNRFFNLEIGTGLSDILKGEAEVNDCLLSTKLDGLTLLTAGGSVRNPAELLQSEKFDKLLATLKTQFELILVDCGPVLMVSDPAIVSQKCDIALLVIRASADTKRKCAEAVRRLRSASANLRGCIVNTFGSPKEFTRATGDGSGGYYYGYGYGYGYGNSYGNRVYGANRMMEAERNQAKSNGAAHKNG